mmetsp:Transcript_13952/g.40099  ORF Transcript_13952/g.40099 Transcript_13952/m.40099 type:complete len:82 (-) Transcript_13952:511-756(-)
MLLLPILAMLVPPPPVPPLVPRLQAIQMVQQKLDVFPRKGQSKDPDLNGFNRHLKDEEFGGGGRFELEVHKLQDIHRPIDC